MVVGDPVALQLLGYAPASTLEVIWRETTPRDAELNQLLPFDFDIRNATDSEARVLVLLVTDEPGKGAARRRSKYQFWQGRIKAGDTKTVREKIHFVDKSRQPKEPGSYWLTGMINGEVVGEREMEFRR